MTLPKLKSAWYSNRGCFSQGLCRICWMVAGSAINRSVSVFNPIASIKTQKDICKTRLLPGEKAWPRLLRYFSQSWCWALCRISLSRLSCSLKFALVFYILLQGCLLWSPSCYVAAKFKEERRERYLLFSFAPLPFCWISRWRPKIKKTTKIQPNTTKLFIRVILGLDAPLQKGFLVWRVHICIIFCDNTNVFWPALRKMTCGCVFQVCH